MNINWSRLATFEYWLEGLQTKGGLVATPTLDKGNWSFWFFLYFYTFLICLGIIMRVAQTFLHSKHPLQLKIPNWSSNVIWIGVLGWIWFISRQLSIWFLGARFWILADIIWLLILGFFILRYLIKFYPLELKYFKKLPKN